MANDLSQVRKVFLVGPDIGNGRYLWVTHFALHLDNKITADHGAMRNASVRVLAESAEPQSGYLVNKNINIALHDPNLLAAGVRPEDGYASLFFGGKPDGSDQVASAVVEHKIANNPYTPVTVIPITGLVSDYSEKNEGRNIRKYPWPNKTSNEIELPGLQLASGKLDIIVALDAKSVGNKLRQREAQILKELFTAGQSFPIEDVTYVPLFGTTKNNAFIAISADGLRSIERKNQANNTNKNPQQTTKKDLKAFLTLTPQGLEFEARIRLEKTQTTSDIFAQLRIEPCGIDQFRLVLIEEIRSTKLRNGIDQVVTNLRTNKSALVLGIKPGKAPIQWPIVNNSDKTKNNSFVLKFEHAGHFQLSSGSITASFITDRPQGGSISQVAELREPECEIIWQEGGKGVGQLIVHSGDANSTPTSTAITPQVQIQKKDNKFTILAGKTIDNRGNPVGALDISIDPTPVAQNSNVYFALERGVLQVPFPKAEKTSKLTNAEIPVFNAFDGIIQINFPAGKDTPASLTLDEAVAVSINVNIPKDNSIPDVILTCFGAVGALTGAVWAARAKPSAEEIIPTLDNGPISVISLPVRFGKNSSNGSFKGTLNPIKPDTPTEFSVQLTSSEANTLLATSWTPHPDTMPTVKQPPSMPPVISALNMTRTAPNATQPSQTRDLIPIAYYSDNTFTLAANFSLDKNRLLPSLNIPNPTNRKFGWTEWSMSIETERSKSVELDIPLVALTLPGVTFNPDEKSNASLCYTLPVHDELHANMSPKRSVESQEKQTTEITSATPMLLFNFWLDQNRRRNLALTQDDIFWSEDNLIETSSFAFPFKTQLDVILGAESDEDQKLWLGKITINDKSMVGEDALKGLTQNFKIENGTLCAATDGAIKITGFSTASYPVKIGNINPEYIGNAYQDTRGHAFAKTARILENCIYRETHSALEAEKPKVNSRRLITTQNPIKVKISNNINAELAFRDLPANLDVETNQWTFEDANTPESKAGPDAGVFDHDNLPNSVYEWRHYPEYAGELGKTWRYEIPYGAFSLKPLRLKHASFDDKGNCTVATIVYGVRLRRDSKIDPKDIPPFSADDIYSTGNVLEVAFKSDHNGGLEPSAAQTTVVRFQTSVQPTFNSIDLGEEIQLTFGTALCVSEKMLVVVRDSGYLEAQLFGSVFIFETLTASIADDKLNIRFSNKEPLNKSGLKISEATFELSDNGKIATFVIKSSIILESDGEVPLLINLGGKTHWYGAAIKPRYAKSKNPVPHLDSAEPKKPVLHVDHGRGLVRIDFSDAAISKSLFRGVPKFNDVKGFVLVALKQGAPKNYVASISSARIEIAAARKFDPKAESSDTYFSARYITQTLQPDVSKLSALDMRLTLSITPRQPEYPSVIKWPLDQISGNGVIDKETLNDLLDSKYIKSPESNQSIISILISNTGNITAHEVTPYTTQIEVPAHSLKKDNCRWVLKETIHFKALTKHKIINGNELIKWIAIDDIAIADLAVLTTQLEQFKGHIFSPRYQDVNYKGGPRASNTEVPRAGIVRTMPLGRALGDAILKAKTNFPKCAVWPGLIMYGGAVHEVPIDNDSALTFGLPWIVGLNIQESIADSNTSNKSSNVMWPISEIRQMPKQGAASKQVKVALFDVAACVPHAYREEGRRLVASGNGSVANISAELATLGINYPIRVADLAFASNLRGDPADANLIIDTDFSTPIFWRALFALKRLCSSTSKIGAIASVFGDPASSKVYRLLATEPSKDVDTSEASEVDQLIVLGRDEVRVLPLPPTISKYSLETLRGDVKSLQSVAMEADAAVTEPLAAVVASVRRDELVTSVASQHKDFVHHSEYFHAPLNLHSVKYKLKALRSAPEETFYASPALGWPTNGRIGEVSLSTLSLGEETPLQDSNYAWAGRARRLSGNLVAPTKTDDTKASFLALGRRVIFQRGDPKKRPELHSPPDRGLIPVAARARAPLHGDIQTAFDAVANINDPQPIDAQNEKESSVTTYANFLPGHYEIVTTGVRPGAMVMEHEGILLTEGDDAFDEENTRFGRSADRAPVVWHQVRAPRSTGLPNISDMQLRRRTFVAQNIRKGKDLAELMLISGAGSVIRYAPSTIIPTIAAPQKNSDELRAIKVQVITQLHNSDVDFANRQLKVVLIHPMLGSYNPAINLSTILTRLGYFNGAATACLNLNNKVFYFSSVEFEQPLNNPVTAIFQFKISAGLNEALETVTAETRAYFEWHPSPLNKNATDSTTPINFNSPAEIDTLPAGEPRVLSIRLPLFPYNVTYLKVPTAVAIFGDPAYDLELAGPAKMATIREATSEQILSLDRSVYDVSETIHLVVGTLDPEFRDPKKINANVFISTEPAATYPIKIQITPKSLGENSSDPRYLLVGKLNSQSIKITAGIAYGLSIPSLTELNGKKANIQPGDRLSILAYLKPGSEEKPLKVDVDISEEPVIAPPASVYGLVTLDKFDQYNIATPALFASSPLPSRIEFPDLVNDLARGHVRRKALFVWSFSPRTSTDIKAALVKIDRTGGGQIPSIHSDFINEF